MRNIFLALFFGVFFSFSASSQVDSVSVTVSFSTVMDSTSLDSSFVAADFMTANLWVNDTDFVGKIMVSVYDLQTGHPLARVKFTSQELEQQALINGNSITIPVGFLSSTSSYSIKTKVQNFQMSYLPEVVISFP